jgi:hypothetical protein
VTIALLGTAAAAQPPPERQIRAEQPEAIEEALRVRFHVVVTADQTVLARVHEFLDLIATRNSSLTRFSTSPGGATAPELELVLLFEDHPRMPGNRRDLGTVNLRLNPEADTAAVEYCLRRCTEPDADLAVYRSTLSEFLQKLDQASAILARRWRLNID